MSPTGKRVFVSYSHKDYEDTIVVPRIFTHLYGLKQTFPDLEIWIDQKMIRVGDQWLPEIDAALRAADVAVMIISPEFLASPFIRDKELAKLRERRTEANLRLVPIILLPCFCPSWLSATETRPRGARSLSEIHATDPPGVDRALKQVMEEVAEFLGATASRPGHEPASSDPGARPQIPRRGDMTQTRGIALLTDTLLSGMTPDAGAALAAKLVQDIGSVTELTGAALFDAVRFFVEFELLRSDDPTSSTALEKAVVLPVGGKAGPLLANLLQRARTQDFASTPVEVSSRFFVRTHAAAGLWKRYFDHLVAAGAAMESSAASLIPVRVTMGFLSPQFLVAGLLSRFDDDWRPVLSAYQRSVPRDPVRGAFESLQASQWNCWLMWGPSIPVCQCDEWKGLVAIQYGYGDENNSVTVVERVSEAGVPKTLGPVLATLRAEARGARFAVVTGRVRWGPFFLERQQEERVLRDTEDQEEPEPSHGRLGMAGAQAGLYDKSLAHGQGSDSVVLELVRVDESLPESRVYFSAYLWTMFLVTTATPSDQEPGIGPLLLRGKRYPRWSDDPADRRRMRDARLWEDLLPIFVHANIGDPAALRFQKGVLVENAVHLLRHVWARRADLFDARDVAAGIRFHLVGASDYSGCGCEIRFPAPASLVEQLRERIAADGDRAFAQSIVLPEPGETPQTRPWGLAGFFSACHLPEMIINYHDHVAHLEK